MEAGVWGMVRPEPERFPRAMTILVLGATGKTGRRVAAALGPLARPASRSSEVRFDWSDPDTWKSALDGANGVYLVPSKDPAQVASFVSLAVDSGVSKIVLLSMRSVPDDYPFEVPVRTSGVDWTILRPVWFMQNFSEDMFLPMVEAGEAALPTGDGVHPFVDVHDIADVAVAALTSPGHAGQVYELTGPEALSFPDAFAHIGAASGREIKYVDIPAEDFTASLRETGLPEETAQLVTGLLTDIRDGREARLSDGVQRVLGREPRSFADYVRTTWAATA